MLSLNFFTELWTKSERKNVLKNVNIFFKKTITTKNMHINIRVEYLPSFIAYLAK
nr:hypothetical protein [uncultured bacterium]